MKRRLVALAVLTMAGVFAAGGDAGAREAVACKTISKEGVERLFDRWNDALATKRPDVVAATYAPDASLLPTVENGPLIGREQITGYFVGFLKKSPAATIKTRVIKTGCNIAYDIGLYDFMVDGDQPNTRKDVKARYTFIYAPDHGKWLIVHHHSSAVPEPDQ